MGDSKDKKKTAPVDQAKKIRTTRSGNHEDARTTGEKNAEAGTSKVSNFIYFF